MVSEDTIISSFVQGSGMGAPLAVVVYILYTKLEKIEGAINQLTLAIIYGKPKPPISGSGGITPTG